MDPRRSLMFPVTAVNCAETYLALVCGNVSATPNDIAPNAPVPVVELIVTVVEGPGSGFGEVVLVNVERVDMPHTPYDPEDR